MLQLTKLLKQDISEFETRMEEINEEAAGSSTKKRQEALREVQRYMDDLLARIEEAIPLISLALTTSGANLSSRMSDSVSPGRFLQAGRFLSDADSKFESLVAQAARPQAIRVQVGPSFTLTMYTIFYGQSRHISWKEEFRRCKVKLWRVNGLGEDELRETEGKVKEELEYSYVVSIDESFRDDRYHDSEERPRRRVLDVATVTRLFFSASGKLLQIDESRSPVLVLKLNTAFDTSLTYGHGDSDPEDHSYSYEETHQHLADSKHVEWLAFEQFFVDEPVEIESDEGESSATASGSSDSEEDEDSEVRATSTLAGQLESLAISEPEAAAAAATAPTTPAVPEPVEVPAAKFKKQFSREKASLSLLEYLVRLTALQANDQESIYQTHDERIALYLSDENAQSNKDAGRDTGSGRFVSSSSEHEFPHSGNGARRRSQYTKPGTSNSDQPMSQDSGGGPRTPPPRPSVGSASGLTPWERDRLQTRRQVMLMRRALESSSSIDIDSPYMSRRRPEGRPEGRAEGRAAGSPGRR